MKSFTKNKRKKRITKRQHYMNKKTLQDNKFLMKLYLDRLSSNVRYPFSFVHDGWHFDLCEISLTSERDAMDSFKFLTNRDRLCYPSSIGIHFEDLLNDIHERRISEGEIQERVDYLCNWISDCERNKPQWF